MRSITSWIISKSFFMAMGAGLVAVYASDGVNRMWRYDGLMGKGGLLKKDGKPFWMTDVSVGADGLLYARTGEGFSGALEKGRGTFELALHEAGAGVKVVCLKRVRIERDGALERGGCVVKTLRKSQSNAAAGVRFGESPVVNSCTYLGRTRPRVRGWPYGWKR